MDEQTKTRGRPRKYFTEEEKKLAQKESQKKYFDSKEKDDVVFQKMRASSKIWKQKKREDPEYKVLEKNEALNRKKKKEEYIKSLEEQLSNLKCSI